MSADGKSLRAMAALAWLIVWGHIWFASHGNDEFLSFQSQHLLQVDDRITTTLAGNEFLVVETPQSDYQESPRLLQADNSTDMTTTISQTELIKNTCKLYLSIFAALFIVFLLVRSRYPRVYNFKESFPAFRTPVAEDSFGGLSWIHKVFKVSDEDIREHCGMDALTTIRVLESGVKLSLVGIFNSVFLFPIYSSMGEGNHVSDSMYTLSLSNLGEGSNGTVATTFSAYTLFGAAMYFIAQDFEWFTAHRHEFLSRKCAQNCTVFLSGLPPDMQTNKAVRNFFQKCFAHDAVAEVHVALTISELEKAVAKRNGLVPKLEHAINVLIMKKQLPMHKTKVCGGKKVESVPTYSTEIVSLNSEIESRREWIESMHNKTEESFLPNEDVETGERSSKFVKKTSALFEKFKISREEGFPRNAAFVTFSDLTSANIARQTVHHPKPWSLVPAEPPMPDFVNWKNVGKSNKIKHIGELMSFVLTVVLCIFWTIPVAFVSSLSNVENLTDLMPFLKEPVEKYAWFSTVLALLAPLLLVIFTSLLPKILLMFVKLECLIEVETMHHPSLFSKLATFTILQTFFISTISATLFESLQAILDDPSNSIKLLSEALPSQAAFFIQLIIVQDLVPLGIELLRILPVVKNQIRIFLANALGHNLTEKERNETFMGLQGLGDSPEYFFGLEIGSKIVLLFMVLYVYSCMSPITSYFTLLVFGFLAIGLRNQFIFIYPVANDSGGKLWLNFQRITVICMLVAEIILLVLIMSKRSTIAAILILPLIIQTFLFKLYLNRRHYSVTRCLPMAMCSLIDGNSENEGVTASLKDAYLQPALKGGSAFPENYSEISFPANYSEIKEEIVGRNVPDRLDEDETAYGACDDRNDYSNANRHKKKRHSRQSKDDSLVVSEGMVEPTERNVSGGSDEGGDVRNKSPDRNLHKKKHRNLRDKDNSWDEEDVEDVVAQTGRNLSDAVDEDVTPYVTGDDAVEYLLSEYSDGNAHKKKQRNSRSQESSVEGLREIRKEFSTRSSRHMKHSTARGGAQKMRYVGNKEKEEGRAEENVLAEAATLQKESSREGQGESRKEYSSRSSRRMKHSEGRDTVDRKHRSERERNSKLDP